MPYELNDLFLSGPTPLVNNAAIAHPRKLEEVTEAEWDEVLAVNMFVTEEAFVVFKYMNYE